eukprot:SAG31_NODE_863_length_11394_cov_8.226737_8_plen_104_part_00
MSLVSGLSHGACACRRCAADGRRREPRQAGSCKFSTGAPRYSTAVLNLVLLLNLHPKRFCTAVSILKLIKYKVGCCTAGKTNKTNCTADGTNVHMNSVNYINL